MTHQRPYLSRRGFCLCCVAASTFAVAGGWLSPRAAYPEARDLVSLVKDSSATSLVSAGEVDVRSYFPFTLKP
jgi:hypothetical protein